MDSPKRWRLGALKERTARTRTRGELQLFEKIDRGKGEEQRGLRSIKKRAFGNAGRGVLS